MKTIFDYFRSDDIDKFKEDLIEFWNIYSNVDDNELTSYARDLKYKVKDFVNEIKQITI